ncbi:aldehyde dehydrogenase [Candidatus Acidianus copahuensis]|uniref:Aldehyde dehydrogenase n=1 Tax=Candidatus Acidianus copahuensis TaxID=1160895 RepID=A0A031LK87_9CREN|nr:aldehyde dehydrogenase family protein [Candidatus Acidianus copahuensis]EZQ01644.1 aldehyde dehydrogenase [Candidatus Acidianus copahuensis]
MKVIIGSERVETEDRITLREPATGKEIDYIPLLDRDKVKEAIDIAFQTLDKLQAIPPYMRSKFLHKASELIRQRQEELATLMVREIGRPIKSSRVEILRAAQIFDLAAEEIKNVFSGRFVPLDVYEFPPGNENRIAFVKRDPVGVVASITPFNFPAASFAHKVAPALAVGNTVVHKPTILAPLTQIRLAEILLEVGFPPGSINIVTGNSEMIGEEFTTNPKVSLITFTGSSSVGLNLASRAIANGKRAIMELGGSDAMIVLEDADIQRAVNAAITGRFDYAGQFCNATKRIIVRKEIATEFSKALSEKLSKIKMGNPLDEGTDIGPLITKDAVENMKSFLDDAIRSGAEVVYQGKDIPTTGYFFPPTILKLRGFNEKVRVMKEEIFGPLLPMVEVSSDDEAVSIANTSEYGLDASVFTKDFSRAYKIASKIKSGTVMINDVTRLRWDNLPFGGFRKSGIGREGVRDTMLEMTEVKVVEYNLS